MRDEYNIVRLCESELARTVPSSFSLGILVEINQYFRAIIHTTIQATHDVTSGGMVGYKISKIQV
jgi:hypothetical protein